jgi:hypothetical protein
MNLHAWGRQRAEYSRARHGRGERGASLVECALIQGVTQAMGVRLATTPATPQVAIPRPVVQSRSAA